MIEIKDLLVNFRNIILSGEAYKEVIQEVFLKVLNLQIKREDIEVKNGTLYLKIKPIYKNEIFIKKDEILFEIEKLLGKKSPKDIR